MAKCVLLRIVSDLVGDPALRQHFDQSPETFLKNYDPLPEPQRSALFTMDRQKIGAAITAELMGFDVDETEFPPCSEEYLPEGSVDPLYPDPKPSIFRFRPKHVKLSDLSEPKFELIVTGQSFAPGATLEIQKKVGGDTAPKLGVSYTLLGTYRCSRIYAIVGPPPGQTPAIPPGAYVVKVINSKGKPNELPIQAPSDLTIVA